MRRLGLFLLFLALALASSFFLLSRIPIPEHISYGVTYSKFRADELNLPWRDVYRALLDDLGVRKFRLVAHWPMIEPEDGVFDFSVMDYEMRLAEEYGADVTLAIGRRLPSWPECHEPEWAQNLNEAAREERILQYMERVIDRYRDSTALIRWQVENEPFIIGFAYEHCGKTNPDFLDEQIALVRALDPGRPILLTASGELGLWNGTWRRADVFGTTLYRRVWNADLNMFLTYPTTPSFFRAKKRFTELTEGPRPGIISELAAEPWPVKAIVETPLEEQLARMDIDFFDDTILFASQTGFDEQYLWGAEWWYYLKEVHDYPDFWNHAKSLFQQP